MHIIIPLAESDLFLQKMTIKTKNPPESNLSSIQEDFSLSALSVLYRHTLCRFIRCHRFCCFLLVCFKHLRSILKRRFCHYCKFNQISRFLDVNSCLFPILPFIKNPLELNIYTNQESFLYIANSQKITTFLTFPEMRHKILFL